jgi:phage shock protein C|tara:strand:- start:228 stop:356 length:129 start_codon:yes stop_codon:yes gene_type:complete
MTKAKNTKGKRLFRSKTNRVLAGVCGGIGDYFNVDPTLIRLL